MQIVYTFTRPDANLPWNDLTIPGIDEYLAELFNTPGIVPHNTLSNDGLVLILYFTMDDCDASVFEGILDRHREIIDLLKARNAALGITLTRDIIL